MTVNSGISRRQWLLTVGTASLAMGHTSFGPVRPALAVPNVSVQWNDGTQRELAEVLTNRVTAIQWIFTSCLSTCPMQGAIFQRIQKRMPDHSTRGIQLLTLSVDPVNDSPKALSEWSNDFMQRKVGVPALPPNTTWSVFELSSAKRRSQWITTAHKCF